MLSGLIEVRRLAGPGREAPLVADASIDVVVSNCVLNLVRESEKTGLIREIFRVLRPGGRIAIWPCPPTSWS